MKEFTTAVEEVVNEDEREAGIAALIAEGKTREEAEAEYDGEKPVEFKVDGRLLRAYPPTDGQLAFMLAVMGRGQTDSGRFAGMINVMLECLRGDDKDYIEHRLLTSDPKERIGVKALEDIFKHLIEEWFARPTQP